MYQSMLYLHNRQPAAFPQILPHFQQVDMKRSTSGALFCAMSQTRDLHSKPPALVKTNPHYHDNDTARLKYVQQDDVVSLSLIASIYSDEAQCYE